MASSPQNFGTAAERFREVTFLNPELGGFFHDPDGYPGGQQHGWRRESWLGSLDEVWELLLAKAGGATYSNFHVFRQLAAERNPPAWVGLVHLALGARYCSIPKEDRDRVWPQGMAIVIGITDGAIEAIYRDPAPPESAPSQYCVISI